MKTNYGDERRHESFIQLCLSRENLPFASTQYRTILMANPTEDIAKRMQDRIVGLATSTYVVQASMHDKAPPRFRKLSLFAIVAAVVFIITGIGIPTFRPMIAVGVAILAFVFVIRALNRI